MRCTKDACSNHLCEKCLRCSDCCECQVALDGAAHPALAGSGHAILRATVEDSGPDLDLIPEPPPEAGPEAAPEPVWDPAPEPLPPYPAPDPNPSPDDETLSPDVNPSGGDAFSGDDPKTGSVG